MFGILVPLDGSPLAESATQTARAIARATHGRIDLVLVQVVGPIAAYASLARAEEPRTIAEEYLQRTAEQLARESSVEVGYAALPGGAVDMICAHAKQLGTDLIVMTTHGRTGFSRAWIGSVADGVVRSSSVPVLLLRASEGKPDRSQTASLTHFVIPLDGSALATQVLDPALALAAQLHALVTLVRVVLPVPLMTPVAAAPVAPYMVTLPVIDQDMTDVVVREANNFLSDLAAKVGKRVGMTVATRVIASERPAAAILALASEIRADVIAMTTQGRGASRLLVGSVADKVLRGTTVPLLLYRPRVATKRARSAKRKQVRIAHV